MKKIIFLALALILVGSLTLFVTCNIPSQKAEVKASENYYTNSIATPPIPDEINFAGEAVPIDVYWVRENLEKECISQCYLHSRTILIFKRSSRFFPIIEEILKEENVPLDFKYLCLAESGLENVSSPAKASGFWQFLEGTGRSYGLEITEYVDERYNLEKSTHAACKYLKKLYERFGSWTLAAAAYNMGENGLAKNREMQGNKDYYDLWLNSETSRYLFRIISFKLLFENPTAYGIHLNATDYYQPISYKEISVSSSITDLNSFATRHNCLYREIKELNPWLRSTKLPVSSKPYKIKVPEQSKAKYFDLYNKNSK